MADIFISYARADRDRIEKLAAALETEGYSVWWDRYLESGAVYSANIERELHASKVVIVCWSEEGCKSRWVKDEATIAAREDKLRTISLDGTEPPIGYMQYHVLDMSGWNGGVDEEVFVELAQAARAHFEKLSAEKTHLDAAVLKSAAAPATRQGRLSLRNPKVLGGAAAVLAVVIGAITFAFFGAFIDDAPMQSAVVEENAIAVLPFANMSADPEQEFFSDGITEELLNVLAQAGGLEVAGRTSSFAFKGANRDLREIGEILNVSHIVEGSVRKSGNRIRITAQLIKASDGFHLWSQTYDRELTDIFALQDEIAAAILSELREFIPGLTVSTPAPQQSGRSDITAYELFLRARELMTQHGGKTAYEEARTLLEQSIAIDPQFAPALAWRAYGESMLSDVFGGVGDTPIADALPVIKAYSDRALAADPDNAESQFALGAYYGQIATSQNSREHLDLAIATMRKAVEIRPTFPQAQNDLAFYLRTRGDTAEAIDVLAEILEHDPGLRDANSQYLSQLRRLGRIDEAETALARWRRIRPNLSYPILLEADILRTKGKLAEAWRVAEEVTPGESSDEFRKQNILGVIRWKLGDGDWLEAHGPNYLAPIGAMLNGDTARGAALIEEIPIAKQGNGPIFGLYIPTQYAAGNYESVIKLYKDRFADPNEAVAAAFSCNCNGVELLYSTMRLTNHDDAPELLQAWTERAATEYSLYEHSPSFRASEGTRAAFRGDTDAARREFTIAIEYGWRSSSFAQKSELSDFIPDDAEISALRSTMRELINIERAEIGLSPLCNSGGGEFGCN